VCLPVDNKEEQLEAGDPRPEADFASGTPEGYPVRLADAIGEWAAQQDPRHLPPGWPTDVGNGAIEAG